MAGNPFEYKAYNLLTAGEIDTLPLTAVNVGRQVNVPGPFAGQLAITDPRVQALNWQEGTRPGAAAMFVDLAGVLVWGGIIWTRRYAKSRPQLVIGASEFGSYFKQRLQAADYSTTWAAGADPMTIAKTICNDALNKANGNLMGGITLTLNPVGGSGTTVAPSYPGTSVQTIESIVTLLSQMGYGYGFDYSFDVAYLPGTKTPSVTMNFWYPRQGRVASVSNIVVNVRDALDFTYDEDATQCANAVTETGSGTTTPATASASIAGYPLMEKAIARSQVTDEGTLANISLGDLAVLAYPVVTPSVTVPLGVPDSNGNLDPNRLNFGSFGLGDNFLFKIEPTAPFPATNENSDPRFPNGMSFEFRINAWTCTVPDKPAPIPLKLDASMPPINTIPPPAPPLF